MGDARAMIGTGIGTGQAGPHVVWIGSLGLLGWIGCWIAINGGPWYLEQEPEDLGAWFNAARSIAPVLLAALWVLLLPLRFQRTRIPSTAEALWIGYALLSLNSAILSGAGFPVWYWSFAFLGVFAVIDWSIGTHNTLARAIATNQLMWLLTTLFLIWMLIVARDVLLVDSKFGVTAYGLVRRTDLGQLGPISRSTGMARLAAIPAVIGLSLALFRRGSARLPWVALLLGSLAVAWWVQARQGLIGLVFALSLVAWLSGQRTRLFGAITVLMGGIAIVQGLIPEDWLRYLSNYATRGEGLSAIGSMTGRDLIWRYGWSVADTSPWIGFGPQADRRLMGLNAQNGVLYAALAAGYPGAALYLGGLLWGWVLYVRALVRGYAQNAAERLFLIQLGGIMAYLSIRNIPENTAALFSVDLLIHAPLLAFLGTLERTRGPAWQQAQRKAPEDIAIPPPMPPRRMAPNHATRASHLAPLHPF